MTIKLICSFVIIAGCGYIGIRLASGYDSSILQIDGFMDAFKYLETEILMNNSVLSEAMENAAGNRSGVAADIFRSAAAELQNSEAVGAEEVWLKVIDENKSRLCVSDDVIDIIRNFSALLGSGTRESEADNIRCACEKLKLAREEAMRKKARDAGLFRGLGFACGILITVLLL